MWKPDESLDDYNVPPVTEMTSEPPRAVSLRRTGEIKVLKPLTRAELRTKSIRPDLKAPRPSVRLQPLWFRGFLAAGSGALVTLAVVLVSAILIGINDLPGEGERAADQKSDETATQPNTHSFEVFSTPTFTTAIVGADTLRLNTRRRQVRFSTRGTARPKRQWRPSIRRVQPKFVPTTLVIYARNGVINTRIEPWLQAANKKGPTFNN